MDAGLGRALVAVRARRAARSSRRATTWRTLEPYVEDSGEGRWTVEDAIDKRVPMPVDHDVAVRALQLARQNAFAAKVNAALRNQFGGHAVEEQGAGARRTADGDRPHDLTTAARPSNPLTEGLERLPVHPTTLVIFGASGDLAKRKLLPAIYNLAHEGALPERFNLIGCARSDWSDDEFREIAKEAIEQVLAPRQPTTTVLDVAARRASATCRAAFDDATLSRRDRRDRRGGRRGGRARRSTALLPVDGAAVLRDDRRAARRARA